MSLIESHSDLGFVGDVAAPLRGSAKPPPLPARKEPESVPQQTPPVESVIAEDGAPPAPEAAAPVSLAGRLRALPSWLISTIVHLVVLIVLAMWMLPAVERAAPRTLFAAIGPEEVALEEITIAPLDMAEHEAASAPLGEAVDVTDLTAVGASADAVAAQSGVDVSEVSIGDSGDVLGDGAAAMGKVGGAAGTAEFFGVKAGGRKFVFVVDSSNSMRGRKFADAKRELLYAVSRLDKTQAFYVIFFDQDALCMFSEPGTEPEPRPVLATSANINRLKDWLPSVEHEGRTNPLAAMKIALKLHPDAIYILSDGQFTDGGRTVSYLAEANVIDEPVEGRRPKFIIHAIGFYSREGEVTLSALAKTHGGTYQFVARPK